MTRSAPHVVVCGAGFGGLWAAGALAGKPVQVTLVDRTNYHTFLPLLYQVAAAELGPSDIAYPIRSTLRGVPNIDFRMAEIVGIDLTTQEIVLSGSQEGLEEGETGESLVALAPASESESRPRPVDRVRYDYLVLAIGSVPNFFGVEGAAEHAFPLRTMEHAIPLRHHVLSCFERASHESDPVRKGQLLTFTIVGGGPTGVEYAGALAELIYGPLLKDFKTIQRSDVEVVLVEAGDGVLAGFPPRLRAYALKRLRKRGVTVHFEAQATRVTADSIELKNGTTIPTDTVVWTAGVKGAPWLTELAHLLPLARGGRVQVTPELHLPPARAGGAAPSHPEVYVVGDLALVEGQEDLPQVAQVAMQSGRRAAENILATLTGKPRTPFRYKNYGMLAVIGRNAAVADVGPLHFKGFPAWLFWIAIHIAKLIGFRNRALVLVNWAWNYLRFRRAVRLILPAEGRAEVRPSGPLSG